MKKQKHDIVAIIPARYASTRLPAKPLVDLCGKPMIQRVVEQARKATLVTRVIVATDDERISSVVKTFGGEVAMTPASIRSGSDRIAFVAKELPDADIIVNVQGDEPLIAPEMIDETIRPMISDPHIQVATLVKKITTHEEVTNPNTVKVVVDAGGNGIYFSRSPIPYLRDQGDTKTWHKHHVYYKHFGLYAYRRELLMKFSAWEESSLELAEKLEQLRIIEHGVKIKTSVTTFDSIPIDTADDAERVRAVLQSQQPAGKQ